MTACWSLETPQGPTTTSTSTLPLLYLYSASNSTSTPASTPAPTPTRRPDFSAMDGTAQVYQPVVPLPFLLGPLIHMSAAYLLLRGHHCMLRLPTP